MAESRSRIKSEELANQYCYHASNGPRATHLNDIPLIILMRGAELYLELCLQFLLWRILLAKLCVASAILRGLARVSKASSYTVTITRCCT